MKFYKRLFWLILLFLPMACGPVQSAEDLSNTVAQHVNDGDTIRLKDGRRVRYLGIDAPEIDHQNISNSQPFAVQARRRNQQLVRGRQLRLEFDQRPEDRYGRRLAYVFLEDGTFINETLIAEGLAVLLPDRKNRHYAQRLLNAQRKAMQARRGLWADLATQPKRLYIGNRGSRRFHATNCASAKKISPHNRVRLFSRWEAHWKGYAPARGCLGRPPVK